MPLFDYRCNECGHEFERMLKIAEMNSPEGEPCPSCAKEGTIQKYLAGAPPIGDPVRLGVRRLPGDFKEVLSEIHRKTYKSNLNQKF